jgi:histidinol-phosphatase (PHP family)
MVDYHVHSDYSQDAEGSVFDFCRKARELGLEEICFTPHFEIDPKRAELDDKVHLHGQFVAMRSNWIDEFMADVAKANQDFAPLKVRPGVEVGYDPTIEDEIADWLKRYRFDYVLGSVHCIDHITITAHDENDFYYAHATAQGATDGYFDLLNRAIESRLFDAIGHVDVFKKYGAAVFGNELVRLAGPYWADVFRRIVAHAPLTIEVNTSGLRQAPAEIYPAEQILKTAWEAGLRRVTIGSDAHRPKHLGFGLEQGYELASRLGFKIARSDQFRVVHATS